MTMDATAPIASRRAPRGERRTSSASDPRPHSADTMTHGNARDASPWKTYVASACSTKIPTKAAPPATTADPTARRRKYSTMSVLWRRRASHTRYVEARKAHIVTARTPPTIDVGLIQLDHGSPASPPAGTRPEAMAPATVPMKNGTNTEEMAKAAPKLRRSRVRNTALRKAKLAPRSTMPSAARVKGTNSVSVIEANASEKPDHNTTSERISQTWLASQTGP